MALVDERAAKDVEKLTISAERTIPHDTSVNTRALQTVKQVLQVRYWFI